MAPRPDARDRRRTGRRRGAAHGYEALVLSPESIDQVPAASLYYQSIPPYFLAQRFTIGKGEATRRLYAITSNLNLDGSPMEKWKVLIAQTGAQ